MKYLILVFIIAFLSCECVYVEKKFEIVSIKEKKKGLSGSFFLGCGQISSGGIYYRMLLKTTKGIKMYKVDDWDFSNHTYIHIIPNNIAPYALFSGNYDRGKFSDLWMLNNFLGKRWAELHIYIHKDSIDYSVKIN